MTYCINGKKVTKEEFLKGSAGFDFSSGKPPFMATGMQSFESPIDGKILKNNKDLSAHNREHEVYQLGDDITRKRQAEKKELYQRHLDGDL